MIIVCAPRDDEQYRLGPVAPPPPTAMEVLERKLNFKVGPVEIGPAGLGIGMRIRF